MSCGRSTRCVAAVTPRRRIDLGAAVTRALELWRAEPLSGRRDAAPVALRRSSLLVGETGILVVAWRLAPSDDLADTLLARVRENVANEAEELMWGSPGTMLAAHAMHGWTGEERWAEAWRESADALRARRDADGIWTQQLYGMGPWRSLGPAHGFVGNVHALLQGDPDPELEREAAAVVAAEAVREDGLANWPATIGEGLEDKRGAIRVQWCHGAPGIVATAAPYLDEELLLAGAELTWQAGAHGAEKGAGICHGTAGNGYALLKAFGRTGDELWLERARRFAVHALAQAEQARTESGSGRYSLFTGDAGRRALRLRLPRRDRALPRAGRLGLAAHAPLSNSLLLGCPRWHGAGRSCSARLTPRPSPRRSAAGCSRGCASRCRSRAAR